MNFLYVVSYNLPKICANATWNVNGTTFINQSMTVSNPLAIFVDYNDSIYVAIHSTKKILVWCKETVDPVKQLSVNLYKYTGLFVTINGDIYFENGTNPGRIEKWPINSNSSVFVTNVSGNCHGLFVDMHNNFYCSMHKEHRVIKMSLDDTNELITIAGTGSSGSALNQLNTPWRIFVDTNFHLYVADAGNNRIMYFQPGETYGKLLAGNGTPNGLYLEYPTDIVLDADGFLYIADSRHHRVIRVTHNSYQCIAGSCKQPGSTPNELNISYAIQFDSYGSFYVVDEFNYRIQKFNLSRNSCGKFHRKSEITI